VLFNLDWALMAIRVGGADTTSLLVMVPGRKTYENLGRNRSVLKMKSTLFWFLGGVLKLKLRVLYHLSHAPNPFCLSLFFRKGPAFLPGPALDHDLPTYASPIAEKTGSHCHIQLVFLR
jgi:hypothetical protein